MLFETYVVECCLAVLQAIGVGDVDGCLLERWDLQVRHADVVLVPRAQEDGMGRGREPVREKSLVRVWW